MNGRRVYKSRGEAFACRELESEVVAGVEHYKPGQMAASYITEEEALFAFLTWVNKRGHVVAMLVARAPDHEWEPVFRSYREAGQAMVYAEQKLPEDYELPEGTVRFLREAEASWQRPEH